MSGLFTKLGSLVVALILCGALLAYGVTEEVPLGSISGTVRMKENGQPLPNATVILAPAFEDSEQSQRARVAHTDENGEFSIRNVRADEYILSASAKAHHLDEVRVSVTEGKPSTFDMELKPNDPYLEIYANQRVFTPGESPKVEVHGFGKGETMKVNLYKLDLSAVVRENGLESLLAHFSKWRSSREDPIKYGKLVKSEEHKIANRDAEGVFIDRVEAPSLSEGFYWMQCALSNVNDGTFINVSKVGLVTKSWPGAALCFVTDLATGEPVQGAQIGIGDKGVMKPLGATGADGTLKVPLQGADNDYLLVATSGASIAVNRFYTYGGENTDRNIRIFMYTDRPVYRPGDQVHFKGIVRRFADSDYEMPAAGQANIEIRDPSNTLIEETTVAVNQRGVFHGEFKTFTESAPGTYSVICSTSGGKETLGVDVAAYRKPEFTVSVTPERPFTILGNTAKAKVHCEYYFGAPVVGATVNVSVYRHPDYGYFDDEYEEEYGGTTEDEDNAYGDYMQDLTVTTDENGNAEVEFETAAEGDKPEELSTDFTYSISAYASDQSEKSAEGDADISVVRGDFGLDATTDVYIVNPGTEVTLNVKAESHANDKPVAGLPLTVTVGRDHWTGNTSVFEPLQRYTGATGPDGVAHIKVKAIEGSMSLRAAAQDDQGRTVTAETWLYSMGGSFEGPPTANLSLTLDKSSYNVGDNCKALITTSHPGGMALVTVEADKVLYSKVMRLNEESTLISLPIDKSAAPNATVSVSAIRDKQFLESSEPLVVKLRAKKLDVSIESDRQTYAPGSMATYRVTTKDSDGRPVSAEVSLAIVDEAIYAIKQDLTNPREAFYPRRYNQVQTSYSFPELYLDGGDKAGSNIKVRRKFLDTAAWIPSVQTDAHGVAQITVNLPDNLTSWRATAVAVSDATAVGMATENVKVTKPLTIRLSTPTFLVQQDRQRITATLQNDTGKRADIHVSLQVQGAGVTGDASRQVSVDAGSPETLEWTLQATQPGTATLTAKAWIDGGDSDGVEMKVPIHAHGREQVEREAGEIRGDKELSFNVRPDADSSSGGLTLKLSPTIATSLVDSLDELVDFPYGCVEQTMSRFMPALEVSRLWPHGQSPRPDLEAKIPEIVAEGYARLAKMQHSDGGWGWWEFDDSNAFMTAYVLEGMYRAQKAGFPANQFVVDRALTWAHGQVKFNKSLTGRDRAYLAYALALHGGNEDAKKLLDGMDWVKPTAATLADAVLAYHTLGSDFAAAMDRRLDQLLALAQRDATTIHWDHREDEWGAEPTAVALQALIAVQPESEAIPKIVRYLMDSRLGDFWYSTRDTSFALIGLVDYLRTTKELTGSVQVAISINGGEEKTFDLDAMSFVGTKSEVRLPISDLRPGDNSVKLRLVRGNIAYYSGDLRQVLIQQEIGAQLNNSGLSIRRDYYLLKPERLEDGTLKLMPSNRPVTEFKQGDIVRCKLTVSSKSDLRYLQIEDPIPSNCQVTEREYPDWGEDWSWWWAQTVIKDDRVAFFTDYANAGTSVFEYTMRAQVTGKAHALPATVSNMYDPNQSAGTAETVVEVTN